jgi:PAS domain S-box-containing protein
VGVYQVDKDDKVVAANAALAKLLGFQSPPELEGRWVGDFYASPNEAEEFRRVFDDNDFVENHKAELVKNGGEPIIVAVYAVRVLTADGEYAGREGTMIDVTTEERYRRILEHVPVGLYEARGEDGNYIITHCNEQFALIHQFENAAQVIGFPINRLHANPQETLKYEEALEHHARKKEPVIGYELNVRSQRGREFVLEVNSRLLKNNIGKTVGRIGVVRDIQEEAILRQKIKEFTNDIGAVLHTYTSTLMILQHSINPVIEAMSPSPFDHEGRLSLEDIEHALSVPAKHLSKSLNKLIEFARNFSRLEALESSQWQQLEYLQNFLATHDHVEFLELLPPAFGKAAATILTMLKQMKRHLMPKEMVRDVRNNANQLVRIANLVGLHQARELIFEMDHPVGALREHLTSGVRVTDKRILSSVSSLINQVVHNLYPFAESRGVRFDIRLQRPPIEVEVHEREVVRALGNLVHNAIKYSWQRTTEKQTWISIRDQIENDELHIDIENWGVPIAKDEIVEELIFHIGYRGVLYSDRGRTGTGIGLTDARRVAKEPGGDVSITSHPALVGLRDDDYKNPFLTTATLRLPNARVRRT